MSNNEIIRASQSRGTLFLVGAPRSGSTMAQRMLASHSHIGSHPEPHLMTPLAHLGWYDNVDRAPFDHINAAEALKIFIESLPAQDDDYVAALRAYADTLYGRMAEKLGVAWFLDKTPAYALILPFIERVYPDAKYVVLTRNPLAIMNSYANSFFDGDWERAHAFNPVLERYVPAIARFLRTAKVSRAHLRYENLVADPEGELGKLFAHIGVPNEPQAANYGEHYQSKAGPGDPMKVHTRSRPDTASIESWVKVLRSDEEKRRFARTLVSRLSAEDLQVWGYDKSELLGALDAAPQCSDAKKAKGTKLSLQLPNTFQLKRKVFLALKKDIRQRPHGKVIQRVKYYCDVLLRE